MNPAPEANHGGPEYFSPDDYLVGILRQVIERRQDVRITLDNVGEITISPTRGDFFADCANNLQAFCAAPASSYKVRPLSGEEQSRLAVQRGGHNIDELMWTAGFYASRGRLIEGAQFDVIRMRHWPNLSRLPQTQNTARIVALFTRYPTSLSVAHRLLKIEKSEIFWVYSAARCAGLVHVVNATGDTPTLRGHRHQSLLSMLLGRIARL